MNRLADLRSVVDRSRRIAIAAWRSKVWRRYRRVRRCGEGTRAVSEGGRVAEGQTADATGTHLWTPAKEFDDFALVCCGQPHMNLLSDPDHFSMTHRVARMGLLTVSEIVVGSDMSMDAGEECGAYRVLVQQTGRTKGVYRGIPLEGGPGTASVYGPEGRVTGLWTAGTRVVSVKFTRSAVDDALSDALGRQVTTQPDFAPVMPTDAPPARSWINMVLSFKEQFFRPESVLHQPLVGLPFVDSLLHGFVLAAEHPDMDVLTGDERLSAPKAIRTAVEIIEEEAHLPLTLSAIAARSHVSVRALQQGFRRYLDTSPMAYLRDVRLHRAHQTLLRSDPSTVTVASVAYQWGFTNLGRFAAAHAARYRETPTQTLRRRAFLHRPTKRPICSGTGRL
jgi:AraC-like DNA-binding protein